MMFQAAQGLSIGYDYTLIRAKEHEIAQGADHLMASFLQIPQIGHLCNLANHYVKFIPNSPLRTLAGIITTVAPFGSIIACPFLAAVRAGTYTSWIDALRNFNIRVITPIANHCPRELSQRTTKVLSHLSEHLGKYVMVAMVVGTVALPWIGQPVLAAAIALPVAYHLIDTKGYIPRKVSLVVERYMPLLSTVCLLISGSLWMRIACSCNILSYASFISQPVQRGVDRIIHHYLKPGGPKLDEVDTPPKPVAELNYDQIKQLLFLPKDGFEVNPSHCATSCLQSIDLPLNDDFPQLTALFDRIDWTANEPFLLSKFKDDDRFIDQLVTQFPGESKESIRANFTHFVGEMAERAGHPSNVYLANLAREQLVAFVDHLTGHRRPAGLQTDLDDAISNCSKILPHLLSLDSSVATQKTELEDGLLKLAIEGGNYCARGMKRASEEMVDAIVFGPNFNIEGTYSVKLLQTLQSRRRKLVQGAYQELITQLTTNSSVAENVHLMDVYRKFFSLGFYPMTNNERLDISLVETMIWGAVPDWRNLSSRLYSQYESSFKEVFQELTPIQFGLEIHRWVGSNETLSEAEKEKVTDLYLDPETYLSPEDKEEIIERTRREERVREDNYRSLVERYRRDELDERMAQFRRAYPQESDLDILRRWATESFQRLTLCRLGVLRLTPSHQSILQELPAPSRLDNLRSWAHEQVAALSPWPSLA